VQTSMQTISQTAATTDGVREANMIKGSFAEKYCAKNGLENWEYTESVLTHSLYARARILRPMLRLIPGYFKADREFIASVARIKRLRDFDIEAFAFVSDPDNVGFLRRRLKLRVSAGRLNGLVWSTMRDGSTQPFEVKK
jgi:hypothetical protein